ncbi:hypothetical protein GL307_34450 [Nocardia seriolae]|nr:hypothetical protein [Nocardia seriolae]
MTTPFAYNPKTDRPKSLSDNEIELLLEAHGEDCERAECELRRYLVKPKTTGGPSQTP